VRQEIADAVLLRSLLNFFSISNNPTVSLRYRAPSAFAALEGGATLALSALSEGRDEPFFQGRVRQPRLTARSLACVSRVVGERWFDAKVIAKARLMDPLVTSGDGILRFEGFSGCRSLYVRLDLLPESLEPIHQSSGTTNVDFNQPMRTALTRVRDSDALSLAVDERAFVMVHGSESILERKVELPLAWLRGLASIPIISSRCEAVAELSGVPMLDLFRNLPRTGNGRETHWLQPVANGIRISRTPSKDSIRLTGAKRLLALLELVPTARKLSIASPPGGELTLWTLHFDGLRLTLALSPEVWRGFSGEGAALDDLSREAQPDLEEALIQQFESGFIADEAAIALGVSLPEIRTSLALLASQGQLGFDHLDGKWFRRMLPGKQALIRQSNPRLSKAEAWVAAGAVAVESDLNDRVRGRVRIDADTEHHVAIEPDGGAQCTCFWFGKFGLSRGPCSHIMALRLATR